MKDEGKTIFGDNAERKLIRYDKVNKNLSILVDIVRLNERLKFNMLVVQQMYGKESTP